MNFRGILPVRDRRIVRQRLIKVTAWVYRNLSPYVLDTLKELQIPEVYVQTARAVVLRTQRSLLGLRTNTRLDEDLCDIYRFYIPARYEVAVVSAIARRADLFLPGRGSIFSEEVTLQRPKELLFREEPLRGLEHSKLPAQTGFSGICCIVQRGEGNLLARSVVEMGFSVPVITYGRGMGLRDKLGLLRITIPESKEIISFIVSRHDAEEALHLVSDRARIDQPGRGFIYLFPIHHAVVNTKIRRGEAEKVASIEQIVAAIDELSGNSVWRRRTAVGRLKKQRGPVLTGLTNYTIYDLEGQTADLVRAAMNAGAGGATLSNLRLDRFDGNPVSTIARSREMSDLIIPRSIVDHVLESSLLHGLAERGSNAGVELSSVDMASTYLGR